MSTRDIFGEGGSDEASANQPDDARNVAWRPTCPECEGDVISVNCEAVCADCGLVVTIDALEREPSMQTHAPTTENRTGEWAIEPVNELRADKGLHTTFFLNSDGKGNTLSVARKKKFGRLRERHKRFQQKTRRDNRLNEGFRDIGMLGANLALPEFVQTDAAQFLKAAKHERLPGGRMAWESLAAGAVLLAVRRAGIERDPGAVARYAKTSEERACAAARKIRVQTPVAAPPVRDRVVDTVVVGLEAAGVDVATGLELARVATRHMDIADAEPVGPGTPRLTMAGAAIYAADRLTDGEGVTQADVVAAVERVVPTSKGKIARYSRELYEAAPARVDTSGSVTVSASAD